MPSILTELKIETYRVQLAMVNFRSAAKDAVIYPGDRLALFPKEYPVFADWKDFRS